MENNIAVLILYFEKLTLTIDCLKSIVKSNTPIYVLNNASSSLGWQKLIRVFNKYPNIKFINSEINLGPAGGRNRLIKESEEEWLLFLDNDIHIKTKNWLEFFQKHIEIDANVEAFIPRLYNVHEKMFSHYHKYVFENKEVKGVPLNGISQTNFFPGGASLINRSVFERLGYYDENLFVLEDLEFPIRALVKNQPINAIIIDDIILIHKHIYTSRKEDQTAVHERYGRERNEFAQKYICIKHSIYFNTHWEEWTNQQIFLITKNKFSKRVIKSVFKMLRNFKLIVKTRKIKFNF